MSSAILTEIQLQITTPNGDPHSVAVPRDMRVDAFIRELMPELRLASVDAEGHPVIWHLHSKNTGRELLPEQTLELNGVQDGHRLHLVRKTVAGSETVRKSKGARDSVTACRIRDGVAGYVSEGSP